MPRPSSQFKAIHGSADYYEPLFRARFVRAMKLLQKRVSINALALSMGNPHQAPSLILPRKDILKALEPAKKVLRDARRQGGKLGAERVRALGHAK